MKLITKIIIGILIISIMFIPASAQIKDASIAPIDRLAWIPEPKQEYIQLMGLTETIEGLNFPNGITITSLIIKVDELNVFIEITMSGATENQMLSIEHQLKMAGWETLRDNNIMTMKQSREVLGSADDVKGAILTEFMNIYSKTTDKIDIGSSLDDAKTLDGVRLI